VWSGGIYTCELTMRMPAKGDSEKTIFHKSNRSCLFSVLRGATRAILPVLISFIIAFAVLDSAPTYLTCRHFMLSVMFAVWLVSPFLTLCIMEKTFLERQRRAGGCSLWLKIA
jgi:hypothetical protein